jgi:hypothetical protein
LYTTNLDEPLEMLVRRLLWPIVTEVFPGCVIGGRTVFELRPAADGSVFLTTSVERDVTLPGIVLRARKGPGPLDGDTPLLGVFMASRARAYLENMSPSRARKGVARNLSRREIEERLEAELRDHGEGSVQKVRDEARRLAPALGLTEELGRLDALTGALLGTRKARLLTKAGAARAAGEPYDTRRLDLFLALHADLSKVAPTPRRDPGRAGEERVLPFFEAYFSNFIEGTRFEVGEAREIVFEGHIPRDRPQDAHDVLGTFRVVSDRAEMSRAPRSFDELVSLLKARHARVMDARPDKTPGQFKTVQNQAGTTVFVAPDQIDGTLARGFELLSSLADPFQRAVFTMFLVSEVHPFVDGNGRVARIMMNAELVAAGERRILVPTVFRSNYLTGLKALSQNGITRTFIRSLDFLQSYALAVDFSTYEGARTQLETTNAFVEADEGVRLVLP